MAFDESSDLFRDTETLQVIVPARRHEMGRFRIVGRTVEATPVANRNDLVGLAVDHQQRRGDLRDLVDRIEAIADQRPDGNEPIHGLGDIGDRGERCLEDDRAEPCLTGQLDDDGRAQGFAVGHLA